MQDRSPGKGPRMLEFIEAYTGRQGYAPTFREIQDGCGFSSPSVVWYNLKLMRSAGHVTWDERVSRSVRLVDGRRAASVVDRAIRMLEAEGYEVNRATSPEGHVIIEASWTVPDADGPDEQRAEEDERLRVYQAENAMAEKRGW